MSNMKPQDFAALEKRGNLTVGATLCFPQDRYGMVVVKASKTGTVLYAYRLKTPGLDTGHSPARFDGPWPVWDHTYTEEEMAKTMRHESGGRELLRLNWSEAKQCYRSGGTPVFVGAARYVRNHSY